MKTTQFLLGGLLVALSTSSILQAATLVGHSLRVPGASPSGENVVAGSASFDRSAPGSLIINQSSDRAIINWQDFSIGADQLTRFNQPGANSAALNRVLGGNPSAIYGNLQANGQIYLLNPAGILVGPGGQIDTKGGFTASTLNLSDDSFLKNTKLTLSGNSEAAVNNFGRISATEGNVYLVARHVNNAGSIKAGQTVGLEAGTEVVLAESGAGIGVIYGNGTVKNGGLIQAASAELRAAGGNPYALAINNTGIIRAKTVSNEGGKIVLQADNGTVLNSGILDASGIKGGEVEMLGDHVGLTGRGIVNVSGDKGGGTALIGGDYKGANPNIQNAQAAYVGPHTRINADALDRGDGGKVIVWASDVTRFGGTISGRGGPNGGNGGFAEVSGKEDLDYQGFADMRAPLGHIGGLLLDPKNIFIETNGSDNISNATFAQSSGSDRSYSPAQVVTALNGADLTLQANTDITFRNDTLAAGNAGNGNLTLQAGRSIIIGDTAAVVVTVKGAVTATANDPAAQGANGSAGSGEFKMFAGSSINTSSVNGAITINVSTGPTGPTRSGGSLSGNITIETLNAGSGTVTLSNSGATANSSILRTSANELITATSAALDVSAASAGSVGTSPNPIRITVSNVEARSQGGGVYLSSPAQGVNIGGASGSLTGITTTGVGGSGNFELTATTGNITDTEAQTIVGTTMLATATVNNITLDTAANNYTGAISVTSGSNVTLKNSVGVVLGASTINGDLSVTATTLNITQTAAISVTGNSTFTANAAGASILLGQNNTFTGTVAFAGSGGLLDVTVVDTTALDIPALTLTGNLSVTAGGAITQSGALIVNGALKTATFSAGASNDITLSNSANDFTTAVITSGNNVTIKDANALVLGASTVSGNLTVTTSGAITQSGLITANGASKTATFAAGSANNITLNTFANDFTTVAITSGKDVTIKDANAIDLGVSTVSGNLTVDTSTGNGNITQSGAVSVNVGGKTTTLVAGTGNITLSNGGNDFATVAITIGKDVTLTDANALILGTSTVTGNLTVTTGGALTQSGIITASGAGKTATFAAGSANNITLDTQNNDFATVIITSGNDVNLKDTATGIILGSSTISGNLTVNSTAGAITQSGPIIANVAGKTASFTATSANAITLNNANNDFTTLTFSNGGAAVSITDAAGLDLGTSTTGGALTIVVTTGDITESGAMTVTGVATVTASGTGASITLGQNNSFTNPQVNFTGSPALKDLAVKNINASGFDIKGALTLTGNLSVTATTGSIIQSGAALIVNGVGKTATFTTTPGTGTVDVSTFSNDFTTVLFSSGGQVDVKDANSIDIGTTTITGAFNVTALGAGTTITDSGVISVTGAPTFDARNAGNTSIILDNPSSHYTGAVQFKNTGGGGLINVTVVDTDGIQLAPTANLTLTGNLNVTTGAGTITQGANNLLITGTTTLTAGSANNITLAQGGNDFTSAVSVVSGNDVSLVDANAIVLGASTISGSLTVNTSAGNGAITQTGALIVNGASKTATFNSGGATITLTQAGNDFTTVAFTTTGGNAVQVRDANAIDLGAISIATTGDLTVTSGGAISNSAAVVVGGTTTLIAGSANNITLGAANNFNTVVITSGKDVTINDINTIVFGAGTSTISGDLTVTSAGDITQTGDLIVNGTGKTAKFLPGAAFNVTLNNPNNDFTKVVVDDGVGGNDATAVTLRDANTLDLGAFTISGNLQVTSGGALTGSGAVKIGGTTTLIAGAGNDITLNNAANDFTGAVAITSGNNVTLVDVNALQFGASTVSGDLTVTAGGLIDQTATTIIANGTGKVTSFTTTAGGISLTQPNNFNRVKLTTGGNVSITDAAGLDLGASTIVGTLAATATTGNLTDSGPVSVTLAATLTATAGAIVVDDTGNNYQSTLTFAGAGLTGVTVYNNAAINFGTLSLTGNLTATAVGAITQTAATTLTVSGTATFTALSGNNINLPENNDFTVLKIGGGAAVTIKDNAGGIDLGNSTITGAFSLTANGAITGSGAIIVGGTTTITAGGNDITLNNAANDFSSVIIVSGANVTLVDANAIAFGATTSTVTGNLSVTASGAISDAAGNLLITGTTTLAAGSANNISLVNAANNFTGAVTISSGNNVTLVDAAGGLVFAGASVISGNLTVTATGGTITQSGGSIVANGAGKTASFTNSGANAITLGTGGFTVNFRTIALNTANDATVVDTDTIDLGAVTVGGNLSVTASGVGGGITDSGVVTVTGTTTLVAGAANNIVLNTPTSAYTGAVSVTTGNDVTLVNNIATVLGGATVSGKLNVTSNGAITETGVLTVAGTATFTAGAANAITLDTQNNLFGTVSIGSGQNVKLKNANNTTIDLGTSTVSGTFDVTAQGTGNITDSGVLTITGNATFTAAGGQSVILGVAGSSYAGTVTFPSALSAITIVDTLPLQLAPGASLSVAGPLNVTAAGITQAATKTLTVTGTTTLAAGTGNDITLNEANSFTGDVSITSANNVSITAAAALSFGSSTISGSLTVDTSTASAAITQNGPLIVNNPGRTATFTPGTATLTLGNMANDFTTVNVTYKGAGTVTLRDANAIDLGTVDLSAGGGTGSLSVTSGGAITDSGTLTVPGITTLVAGANDITLGVAANKFTGAVSVTSGRNVTLVNSIATVLGASTISGNLTVASTGAITQSGGAIIANGGSKTATFAAGSGNNITLNTFANDFTTVAITSGNDVTIKDANAIDLGASTVSGNLTVDTSTGNGNITQSGAVSANVGGKTTTLIAGTGNITLSNAGNDFATVAITSGKDVTLTDVNALILGASTVTGNLTVTASGAITQSAAITANGAGKTATFSAGSGNNIDLTTNGAANDFTTVAIGSGNNVQITDANTLNFGNSTISGNLTVVVTTGNITQTALTALNVTGNSTFTANGVTPDITLGENNTFTGTVTFAPAAALHSITVKDTTPLDLASAANLTLSGNLTVTAAGVTQSNGLIINGTTSITATGGSSITLSHAMNNFTGAVSLNTTASGTATVLNSTSIALGTSSVGGDLSVTAAAGNITQSGVTTLTVTGNSTFTGNDGASADILLGNNNTFPATVGAVTFVGAHRHDVTIKNSNGLDMSGLTISGNLSVTTGGAITQSGPITANVALKTATFAAGTGNNIMLSNGANDFRSVIITSGNNVTLRDANNIDFGTSTVSGGLSVTAASVTQTAATSLTVTGTTTLSVGTLAGSNVLLNNTGNDFVGAVLISSANDVTIQDNNSIIFGLSTVSGNLTVTSNGAITQSGAVSVNGAGKTATFAAGSANDITLGNTANDFTTVIVTSGKNVAITDANDVQLGGPSTISGTFGLTSVAGDITEVAAFVVTTTGAATFTASTAGASISVNTANVFNGTVAFAGAGLNNVTVVDTTAFDLQALTLTGNLSVTGAGITQSGALVIPGTTTLVSTGGANAITLNTAANNFTGAVLITSAQNASIAAGQNLTLGTSGVTGTLQVNTSGSNKNITQSGALTITGTTTLIAGTGDITLNNVGNNFSTVAVTSGKNVVLVDANAIDLGASTVTGTFAVTATSLDITDSGNLAITGNATYTAANGRSITLDNTGSSYAGTVSFVASAGNLQNVTVVDTTTFDLQALTLAPGGNLTVTGAGITQSGALVIPGTATFAGGAGNITLSNAGNNFGTVVITSGAAATIVDSSALDFGNVTITGNLSGTATTGNITDSGSPTMTVGGTATFTTSAASAVILLSSTPLAVTGNVIVNTVGLNGNVTLVGAPGSNLSIDNTSVINGALTVTTSGGGATKLNAGTLTTATTQTYTGPVSLAGNVILASTGNGNITFNGTVDAASAGIQSLTSNSTGTTKFSGVVGGTAALNTLTSIVGGTVDINTSAVTAGVLAFNGAVTVEANSTLNGTTSVNFAQTVKGVVGTEQLSISSPVIGFHGIVGGGPLLGKLATTLVTGTTTIDTTAISATTVDFRDSVVLTQPLLTVTGTTVSFEGINGTTASTEALSIVASGVTTIGGDVGKTTKLLSLTTDGPGTSRFEGGVIKATTVTIGDPLTMASDVVVTGTTVTFSGTINADATANNRALTVNASGVTTFTGVIGGTASLGTLTTDADAGLADRTDINANITATTISLKDPVKLLANVTLAGGTISLENTLDADLAGNNRTLTLTPTAGGTVRILGVIGGAQTLATLTIGGNGSTVLKANVTTSGAQVIGNDLIVGANSTLTGAAMTFSKTINADLAANNRSLTVSGGGVITFAGKVGLGTDGTFGTVDDATLGTLTVNGAGTTTISGGAINATTQTFSNAITLTADTTLYGTTATYVAIAGGGKNLRFALTGSTTLTAAITAVKDLTSDAEGTTTINTASITTTGKQIYTDAVTLTANTTLTATDITLAAVTANAPGYSLTLTGSGTTTLTGAFTGVKDLTSNGGGSTVINTTAITTDGKQQYDDAVKLGANVTLTSTGATANKDVIFNGTLNSDAAATLRTLNVTVSGTGVAKFIGITGATTKLSSLTTGGTGSTRIDANITADTQIFNNAVVIGGTAVTLKATPTIAANGDVTFASTLNGATANTQSLTVNASHVTTFTGTVGGIAKLASLTTGTTGSTRFPEQNVGAHTSAITATTQNYQNAVTVEAGTGALGEGTTFTGTTISFKALAGNNATRAVTVNSDGVTTFGGVVSSLQSLTTDNGAGADSTVIKANITATTQLYGDDNVKVSGTATLTGTTITFSQKLDGTTANSDTLTVNGSGVTTYTGAVGSVAQLKKLESDSVSVSGTSAFNNATLKAQTLIMHDDVTLATATTITGTTVTFDRTLTATGNLTMNVGGVNEFKGAVTVTAGSLTTDSAGTTKISGTGTVTTTGITGTQTYADAVVLAVDTTLTGTGVTFNGTLNDSAANTHSLTVNASGVTAFNGIVGGSLKLKNLTTDAAGTTELKGATITLGDDVTFNDAVTVTGSVTLKGDVLDFEKAVNGNTAGAQELTVGAITESLFNSSIGLTASKNLKTFATLSSGAYTGKVRFKGTDVKATTQTYASPVQLEGNVTLTSTGSSGAVTFTGAVNADVAAAFRQLTVNAAGVTTLGTVGNLQALGILITDSSGSTKIGGTLIATTLQFNDNVTLTSATTINNAVSVDFAGTVNGTTSNAQALTVNASGLTQFQKSVGGTASLSTLTTDAAGSVLLKSSISAQTQVYNDDVVLGGSITLSGPVLTSGAVTFGKTVNGDVSNTRDLTINGGNVTIMGAVGNDKSLKSLQTDTAGTGLPAGTVTFSGGSIVATTQTFNDTLLLGANTTLTGTAITVTGVTGAGFNLTLSGTGVTRFNGNVAGVATLLSNNGGTTEFGRTTGSTAITITTTGTQTYTDNVKLNQNTTLTASVHPTISGTTTLNGKTLTLVP